MLSNEVELLVDHSGDSMKARKLLYSLDQRIEVTGIPANGYNLPIAFWGSFTYHGIEGIERLHKRLTGLLDEGKF